MCSSSIEDCTLYSSSCPTTKVTLDMTTEVAALRGGGGEGAKGGGVSLGPEGCKHQYITIIIIIVSFVFCFYPEPDGPCYLPLLLIHTSFPWFPLLLLRAVAALPSSTLHTTPSSTRLSAPHFAGGSLAVIGCCPRR